MPDSTSIPELERVVLTQDLPQHVPKAGDVGTIDHVAAGGGGYVVEFCTLAGDTIAVAPLEPSQIRRIDTREVRSARRLAG